MLTRTQKEEIVSELARAIASSKVVVLSDYRGVNANDMVTLKRSLRENGSSYRVAKKSLIKLAFSQNNIDIDATAFLGQVAIAYSNQDEVTLPKLLIQFAKGHETVKMLGGSLGNVVLTGDQVLALAKLPTRDELRAQLTWTLNAPVTGFVNVLAGNLRGLVQVLKAVGESKSE